MEPNQLNWCQNKHKMNYFFIFMILIFTQCIANACNCSFPSPCENTARSTVIFSGRVIAGGDGWHSPTVKFKVHHSFKGVQSNIFVELDTMSQSSCAAIFEVGKDYLVFAQKINGILQVSLCSRSKQLTDAAEELQYLTQWERGKTQTEIIGTIHLNDSSLNLKKYNRELDKARVHIGNNNQYSIKVKVNSDGNFSAKVPYPGIYIIKATIPNWFDQQAIREINVPSHGCASTSFSLNPDGQIIGTVLDADGSPAKHLTLKIIESTTGSTFEGQTNQHGMFEFRGVQSGNYKLGVNIGALDDPSPESPYPPTIYASKQGTPLIKVRDFEKVELVRIFQLPKRGKLRTIEALVTLEDGSPLSGASLSCTPVGKKYWKKDLTNKYGKISFTGINNTEYIVDAYIPSDHPLASKGYQIAQWVKVPKSNDTTHIHLVFKKK